jgi:catalase
MKSPSTDWKETVAADEAARFARQGEMIRAMHARTNERYGKGRFLHRKELVGARGTFEVYSDLPEHAAHGIFSAPRILPAVVRLSNGAPHVQANAKPDIRGFALRLLEVSGPGALGRDTDHQDFLLINHDVFTARDSDEFVAVAAGAARGPLALIWHLLTTNGLGQGISKLKSLGKTIGKPFAGYAAEEFNTTLPIANGPYAVKVILRPVAPSPANGRDLQADFEEKVAAGPVAYEMSLQFYTDEATTPIENHQARWPQAETPVVPVGRLTLDAIGAEVERLAFDPWGGLADHRPLGEIMRARRQAYPVSARAR